MKFLTLDEIVEENEPKQFINISTIVRIEATQKDRYPNCVARIYFLDGSSLLTSRDYDTLLNDLDELL